MMYGSGVRVWGNHGGDSGESCSGSSGWVEAAHETSLGELSAHKDMATAFPPLRQSLFKIVTVLKADSFLKNGSFKVGDDVMHS